MIDVNLDANNQYEATWPGSTRRKRWLRSTSNRRRFTRTSVVGAFAPKPIRRTCGAASTMATTSNVSPAATADGERLPPSRPARLVGATPCWTPRSPQSMANAYGIAGATRSRFPTPRRSRMSPRSYGSLATLPSCPHANGAPRPAPLPPRLSRRRCWSWPNARTEIRPRTVARVPS